MYKIIILALALFATQVFGKDITATSWLVTDYKGKIIDGENYHEIRPIASVTKLMTAMVVLDARQDLDEKLKIYTRRELIQLAITQSNNQAATTLCENYPGGKIACITAMNHKARMLGLSNTRYVEPTGLSIMNVSTADELVTVVLEASNYPEIVEASRQSQGTIQNKKRLVSFNNTNPITRKRNDIIVSKTGWIRASGGCLVMLVDTEEGRRVVIVLNSKTIKTRIPDAEYLLAKY